MNKLQKTLEKLDVTPTQLLEELNWLGGPKSAMSRPNGFAKVTGRVKMSAKELIAIKRAVAKLTGATVEVEELTTGI